MSTYLISDYHFDDPWIMNNIRKFNTLNSMNRTLLEKAQETIGQEDEFVFLGDLVGENGAEKDAWKWQSKLPEVDTWVVGNHDPFEASNYSDSPLPLNRDWKLKKGGYTFFGRHRPGNLPERKTEKEWGIYGHEHSNHKNTHPFLDQDSRRINISAGLIDYRPIKLSNIIDLIETGISYETLPNDLP